MYQHDNTVTPQHELRKVKGGKSSYYLSHSYGLDVAPLSVIRFRPVAKASQGQFPPPFLISLTKQTFLSVVIWHRQECLCYVICGKDMIIFENGK